MGYAPGDADNRLLAFLHRQGCDREAILATGLFSEHNDGNLYAIWSGRFTLPYLDGDSRALFAISRRLEPAHPADWAGKYSKDDQSAKYHKLPVSHDAVAVEEPIFGLDTVCEGEPVLITEGIADAITAHQAGYPCVLPVRTTFKQSDRERLADVLDAADVPRVYIVQDAKRPGSDRTDEGKLTFTQYVERVRDAVATGWFLAEHGVGVWIGELPLERGLSQGRPRQLS